MDIVREVLSETENQHLKRAKEMAIHSLEYIDQKLIARMKAITALNELLDLVSNEEDIWNEEPRGYMDKLF